MSILLTLVAAAGGVAHLVFAHRATLGWSTGVVEQLAPDWSQRSRSHAEFDRQVDWAAPLAANLAAYNLALAIGLFWLAWAGAAAGALGGFLGLFLLIAAFAAWRTGMMLPAWIQGGLGLLLLLLAR